MSVRTVSVFGLGHVGLATAVCAAKKEYKVVGIDIDETRLQQIRNGVSPFFEPSLNEYLKMTVNRMLSVTNDPRSSGEADLAFLTVGTPGTQDGNVNLSYLRSAAAAIGRSIRDTNVEQLIVVKSTVPPGTTRALAGVLERESGKLAGKGFRLCFNPEFLREGSAIHDTEFPDRIVLGSDDLQAVERVEGFYKELHGKDLPCVIRTSYENAELIKYANNAFLATKVSFINCIANICERLSHTDVKTIAAGIGLDSRIGPEFLRAGLGWGGSCFPKDLAALVAFARASGYGPLLIEAAVATNQMQPSRVVDFAKKALLSLSGKRVALLGLAFKPNTDDMREAVSIPIVKMLLAEGAKVIAYDPAALGGARAIFRDMIEYAKDAKECIDDADCCIIVTDWDEFRGIPPSLFKERMRRPVLIDGRRIYNAAEFLRSGIAFYGIGLGHEWK